MSQLTTHVLDTAQGKPANDIEIILSKRNLDGNWKDLSSGKTNSDGRIADLLEKDYKMEPGVYRLEFKTGDYFKREGLKAFYPWANIIFEVTDDSHYHVPLLLNPFGYSTYRGS